MIEQILILLMLLEVSHFLGDYTHLSTKSMLDAKRFGTPLIPIYDHAFVHTVLTIVFILLFDLIFWKEINYYLLTKIALLQLVSHFLIDVGKGKINKYFPKVQNPANKEHWYVFGFDQVLHHFIIFIEIYIYFKK